MKLNRQAGVPGIVRLLSVSVSVSESQFQFQFKFSEFEFLRQSAKPCPDLWNCQWKAP